jgi:large subunit ribosomal protein L18
VATQKRLTVRRRRRARHVRNRVRSDTSRPRISVHRTNKHTYAQIIDDETGRTLCAASTVGLKLEYGGNIAAARAVGEDLGEKALQLKIERAGFDRGPCKYHGRVKALADAVRAAGVKF